MPRSEYVPFSMYAYVMAKVDMAADMQILPQVAEAAGVNPHWLSKLSCRTTKEPGIHKMEKLYNYFKKIEHDRGQRQG